MEHRAAAGPLDPAPELMEGNRKKAAEVMGIGERTLYRKIKEYGLS